MARLDKARSYDVGVFSLRHLVQSRPVRTILRALAALFTNRFAYAESRGRNSAGRGPGGVHLVRTKSADGRNDTAVAAARTKSALCCNLPGAVAGVELRKSPWLSD